MTHQNKLTWRPYLHPRPLSDRDILDAAYQLGVVLPPDFIALMQAHQGMSAMPCKLVVPGQRSISFGYLRSITPPRRSGKAIVDLVKMWRKKGYPARLVPFTGGRQDHLALEYCGEELPNIAHVYPDPEAAQQGYWSTVKVADSITDMLAKLEPE